MHTATLEKPDYGNWVSTRLIYAPAILGIVFLVLAYWLHVLVILALLFLATEIWVGLVHFPCQKRHNV
jgi:hypothetical protein